MERSRNAVTLLAVALVASSAALAAEVAYQVSFQATWSEQTHPQGFPPGGHFSPPVGVVHNANVVFWDVGGLATTGIESMAETGSTVDLTTEIDAAIAAGNAYLGAFYGTLIPISPGATGSQFLANESFSKVTWVTMIAPSPDWFAGTHGLDLLFNGHWRDNFVVNLDPYDAGTDSGVTFTSPDADTNPADPITLITTPPLATNGYAPPMGTYTFQIIVVDGRPPYGDADGDGLTNLREAELGTDPVLDDSDGDSVLDAADNCPLDMNSSQVDIDADGVGDLCDNCPSTSNPTQANRDADGDGDRCDLNDGHLMFVSMTVGSQTWQTDTAFNKYNLYRGDLQVLLGGGDYTQDPAATNADRQCALGSASANDGFVPASGQTVFYLVTGQDGTGEYSPGDDSSGNPRPNANPCF